MDAQVLWFEELRSSKQTGLNRFIKTYNKTLNMFAFNMVKSVEIAEEIVVDSFLKVWDMRNSFESPQHVIHFLFKVTKNACLNTVEKNKKLPQFEREIDNLQIEVDDDIQFKIIYQEFLYLLNQEIEKLPHQQKKVFKLSMLEGYTTSEICALLQTSSQAVFNAKSKAILQLKKAFQSTIKLFFVI